MIMSVECILAMAVGIANLVNLCVFVDFVFVIEILHLFKAKKGNDHDTPGIVEAPKLSGDWLAKGLYKCGFIASDTDPGIYYGRDMALAVYVDDVLLFGPDEEEMNKVLEELKLDGFDFNIEKKGVDKTYNFLGINVTQEKKEGANIEIN